MAEKGVIMERDIVGILLTLALMLIVSCTAFELRSDRENAIDIVLSVVVGRYGIFGSCWVLIAILAFIFQPVRTVLYYVETIALVIWFIVWIYTIPKRWRNKKKQINKRIRNFKDFFKKDER